MTRAEVEHERAEIWLARAAALGLEVEMLRGLLAKAKRYHYEDQEFPFNSCPKAGNYAGFGNSGRDSSLPCDCGAGAWNAEIDAVLATPVDPSC